jgi:SAM-dependent methyltransferase
MIPFMASRSGLGSLVRLRRRIRYPDLLSRTRRERGVCEVCGRAARYEPRTIIPDDLAQTSGLAPGTRHAMDRRESMCCPLCGNNYRRRQLARALLKRYGQGRCASLAELLATEAFRALDLLILDDPWFGAAFQGLPRYRQSDYMFSLVPAVGRPDTGLPLPDASIDVVLSSDVLEHTPAYMRVVSEIARVLKPGAAWICTLPFFPERATRTRAVVDERGEVQHLMEPSHHCRGALDSLVFVEFGRDALERFEAVGLRAQIYFYTLLGGYDYSSIFVFEKTA